MAIDLDLEETGTLYHMLLRSFLDEGLDPSKPLRPQIEQRRRRRREAGSLLFSVETEAAVLNRQVALLVKLGKENDRLMGKEKPDPE